jgi:hypothetical protein
MRALRGPPSAPREGLTRLSGVNMVRGSRRTNRAPPSRVYAVSDVLPRRPLEPRKKRGGRGIGNCHFCGENWVWANPNAYEWHECVTWGRLGSARRIPRARIVARRDRRPLASAANNGRDLSLTGPDIRLAGITDRAAIATMRNAARVYGASGAKRMTRNRATKQRPWRPNFGVASSSTDRKLANRRMIILIGITVSARQASIVARRSSDRLPSDPFACRAPVGDGDRGVEQQAHQGLQLWRHGTRPLSM